MSFDDHVRFVESQYTGKGSEADYDYPEIPDGKPGAYTVALINGKIEIIDRSKK